MISSRKLWLGNPIPHSQQQQQRRSVQSRCYVAAELLDPASVVGNAVLTFQRNVLGSSAVSSDSWWAVAGPAALWLTLAAPGSISGVSEYLTAPLHALRYRTFFASEVEVGKRIGEGSFGVVYEGYILKGNEKKRLHVILKKAKARVSNSSEMHSTEVYMNRYLQRNAPQAVADFLGTVDVTKSDVKGRLTEGLWLVWKFQGYHTLDHYMKQKTFPDNVARLLLGDNASSKWYEHSKPGKLQQQNGVILRTIMNHILVNLHQLHRSGVIHRDVKPLNLILAEDSETFKFVDLGACVNIRSGYNYIPNETIMDPVYAPPERYVMPTSTPKLPPDPFCSLISPLVWLLNTPDRFDLFSAGLVMMQLAVKPLRHDSEMKNFSTDLQSAGYDLNKWRKRCRLSDADFSLLDADGGAGWELATALLQPRPDKSFFIWPGIVNSRPSAAAALKHRFFRGVTFARFRKLVSDTVPNLIEDTRAGLTPALSSSISQLDMDSEALKEKVVSEMAATVDKIRSQEFSSAVAAAVPVAALTCLGVSSSWMLMKSLESSAQMSYDISRNIVDSIGISAPVSIAFFLLAKPLLGKLQETNKRKQKPTVVVDKQSDYGEVAGLADAICALDSRLDSLEALVSEQEYRDQQAARMKSLLPQPQLESRFR